jgi:hypothetical protein
LETQRTERHGKALVLKYFMQDIKTRVLVLVGFDEKLWLVSVDKVVVVDDDRLTFHFKDGTLVEVPFFFLILEVFTEGHGFFFVFVLAFCFRLFLEIILTPPFLYAQFFVYVSTQV